SSRLVTRGFCMCYFISVDDRSTFMKPLHCLWAHSPKALQISRTPFIAFRRSDHHLRISLFACSFASKHLQHRLCPGNRRLIRVGFHAVFGLLNFFVGSFHGQRRRVCSQLGLHHSALRPRVGNRHSVIIFMNHLPHTPTDA